jgi:hypothetical protein
MILLLAMLAVVSVRGQGVLQHSFEFTATLSGTNVVPPTSSTAVGHGEFLLEGQELAYEIRLSPGLWHGTIHGAARPGENAPVIFDLGAAFCVTTNINDPGVCILRGSLSLSGRQAAELRAGLLYADVISEVVSTEEIRGQILPVRPTQSAHHSGVEGQTSIYVCPVVSPGEVCTFPFQTTLRILSQSGTLVTEARTDANGHFQIALPPGSYQVVPWVPSPPQWTDPNSPPRYFEPYPYAAPVSVAVPHGHFVQLNIVYDAGIY